MNFENLNIGGGELVQEFINEIECYPFMFEEIVIASPFLDFKSSIIGQRLRRLFISLKLFHVNILESLLAKKFEEEEF